METSIGKMLYRGYVGAEKKMEAAQRLYDGP